MNENLSSYISNPLNAFTLIKRLTNDTSLMQSKLQRVANEFAEDVQSFSPRIENLEGAVAGLARLQETYKLSPEEIANGMLDGEKYRDPLSAHDLFVIGDELLYSKNYHQSIRFLNLALELNDFSEVEFSDLLNDLSAAFFAIKDFKKVSQVLDKLLKISSNRDELLVKQKYYESLIGNESILDEPIDATETRFTRKVCRGELKLNDVELSKLHCRYVANSAFSQLCPFKMEEASLRPYIVLYHEVISDKEITTLKVLSIEKLERSVVFDDDGSFYPSPIRVSKVAWLTEKHQVVQKLMQRVEDMTGLTTLTAEKLQVQHYGLGGNYEAHYDFLSEGGDEDPFEFGPRVATALFYVLNFVSFVSL